MAAIALPFYVSTAGLEKMKTNISFLPRIAAVLATAVLLTGCGSMLSVGSPSYACKGLPEGAQCQSTRDMYEATHNGNVPLRLADPADDLKEGGKSENSNTEPASEQIEGDVTATSGDSVIDTYVAPRLPDRPIPIRTPAQVMRIWLAPWEDTSGDLVTIGYIHTEIEPRRWVIAQPTGAQPNILQPLQTINSNNASD